MIDLVGWFGAVVLLLTVGTQVYTQWKSRSVRGVSRWLFVGKITASITFVADNQAQKNWVFVVTNAFTLPRQSWARLSTFAIKAGRPAHQVHSTRARSSVLTEACPFQ